LALEPESGSGVAVALSTLVAVEPNVALFEPLDAEILFAQIPAGASASLPISSPSRWKGKRAGKSGGFGIYIEATVEVRRRPTVEPPTAGSICFKPPNANGADTSANGGNASPSSDGIDPNSPQYRRAQSKCQK
jgi:hypothetical protein